MSQDLGHKKIYDTEFLDKLFKENMSQKVTLPEEQPKEDPIVVAASDVLKAAMAFGATGQTQELHFFSRVYFDVVRKSGRVKG